MPNTLTDPESVVKRAVDALTALRGAIVTDQVVDMLVEEAVRAFPAVELSDLREVLGVPKIRGELLTDAVIEERARQIASLEISRHYHVGLDRAGGPEVTAITAIDGDGKVLFTRAIEARS